MDPLYACGQRQDGSQRGPVVKPVEDYVGFRSVLFQEIEIGPGEDGDGLRETVQEAQEWSAGSK